MCDGDDVACNGKALVLLLLLLLLETGRRRVVPNDDRYLYIQRTR